MEINKGDIACFISSIKAISAELQRVPEDYSYNKQIVQAELSAMLYVLDTYYSNRL